MSLNKQEWFTEVFDDRYGFSLRYTEKLADQTSDFQKLEIFDTPGMGRILILDGCFMLTDKDAFVYHEMITHPAMSVISDPKKVLIIGGGDGGAVTEVVKYPGIESVILCEIDPLVVSACREFFPEVSAGLDDPRAKVINGDGAKYVKEFENEFDLVLVDSTDPVGPAEVLFRPDFYSAVKRSLKKGGVLVCQSESPMFMAKEFRMAVGNLAGVFGRDNIRPYLATIPCYPGGLWSFTFCSVDHDPVKEAPAETPACLEGRVRYYNAGVHKGAFSLPGFVSDLFKEAL